MSSPSLKPFLNNVKLPIRPCAAIAIVDESELTTISDGGDVFDHLIGDFQHTRLGLLRIEKRIAG
jgi:hypothetical protein